MARIDRAKQESILHGGESSGGLRKYLAGTDWFTILLCLMASAYGVLLVHSATLKDAQKLGKAFSSNVTTMVLGVVLGLAIAIAISFIDYELVLKFWYIFLGVCVVLMLLLIPFGWAPPGRGDAIRWFKFSESLNLQPSELLKIAFIISFTWHIHQVRDHINKFKTIVLLGVHALVPFGLVAYTGDLGSALVILFMTMGMLVLAGMKLRWFAAAGVLGAAAAPVLWIKFLSNFQKNRILAVYLPKMLDESTLKTVIYQQQQAVNAIGSGQILGKGLFNGTVSIPVRENDMIFSVAGEELGFVGAMLVLILLGAIITRLILVSRRTRNLRARLLCAGVALMIGMQSLVNIGVCLKLLPVTGITLPFFSAGGTSSMSLYITIGLVLMVFRYQNDNEDSQSYFDYLYTK